MHTDGSAGYRLEQMVMIRKASAAAGEQPISGANCAANMLSERTANRSELHHGWLQGRFE